jgi:uncharacterized protein with NAD-binding domain and iron-sulfur cluster
MQRRDFLRLSALVTLSTACQAVMGTVEQRTPAKTVAGRLLLTGEVTSDDYPATVPGAYLSGLRAAAAILGLYLFLDLLNRRNAICQIVVQANGSAISVSAY